MPLENSWSLTFPTAFVSRAGSQTLTTGTPAKISFTSEDLDPANMVNLGANPTRVTIVEPGIYSVYGTGEFATNATGDRRLAFTVNGGATLFGTERSATANATPTPCAKDILLLVPGDYIELDAFQNSLGDLGISNCQLHVVKVARRAP